jgi:hypothetical protein
VDFLCSLVSYVCCFESKEQVGKFDWPCEFSDEGFGLRALPLPGPDVSTLVSQDGELPEMYLVSW